MSADRKAKSTGMPVSVSIRQAAFELSASRAAQIAGHGPTAGYLLLGVSCAFLIGSDGGPLAAKATVGQVWLFAGILGVAVALSRRSPAVALALLAVCEIGKTTLSLGSPTDVLALAIVTYNCGRRGVTATVWAAVVYIGGAYAFGGLYAVSTGTRLASQLSSANTSAVDELLLALVGTIGPLVVPVLLGITMRMRGEASTDRERRLLAEADREAAQAQRVQAEAIAHLEAKRNALARDVHDVVGHSLAGILAQAESGLLLERRGSPEVRRVLRAIADSARSSLDDVRAVLHPEGEPTSVPSLDALVAGLPPSIDVTDVVLGTPHELDQRSAQAASRTLQEMLTNALRHSHSPQIEITRDWSHGLRLRVSNVASASAQRGRGLGLAGMQRRVEEVGGTVQVDDRGTRFIVEATLPRASVE